MVAGKRSKSIRKAAVPTAVVAGIAVVGVGVWPALASDGRPDLPEVTAEELLTKVAASETEQLSGTVRVDTDLGIPGLPNISGMVDSMLGEAGGPASALAGLASGESVLRVAVDGPDRQRLVVADGPEEFSVIHNGDRLWAYDSGSNTVFRGTVPEEAEQAGEEWQVERNALLGGTPAELARELLAQAEPYADITVDGTARVAGRDAYQLLVEPTEQELAQQVTSVRIAVDGETGVPLALTAYDGGDQLLDLAFSQISYEQPPGGTFDFTPPRGSEVHELDADAPLGGLLPGLLPDMLPEMMPEGMHGHH